MRLALAHSPMRRKAQSSTSMALPTVLFPKQDAADARIAVSPSCDYGYNFAISVVFAVLTWLIG